VTNGRVRVHGRLGFVINTGGEKLWPEDLEAALATVNGVLDVAVTGIEDPEWGERVVALIVSDGRQIDEAIEQAANERVGPWAKPKEIRYVAAIPRTDNGKVRRSELNPSVLATRPSPAGPRGTISAVSDFVEPASQR